MFYMTRCKNVGAILLRIRCKNGTTTGRGTSSGQRDWSRSTDGFSAGRPCLLSTPKGIATTSFCATQGGRLRIKACNRISPAVQQQF